VRTEFSDSLAKPPAAAYCPIDSFWAEVIAVIINQPAAPIRGKAASKTTVSFQHKYNPTTNEAITCVTYWIKSPAFLPKPSCILPVVSATFVLNSDAPQVSNHPISWDNIALTYFSRNRWVCLSPAVDQQPTWSKPLSRFAAATMTKSIQT
jgi:hypothetical protein